MFCHAYNNYLLKKLFVLLFFILIFHAYFYTVLLQLNELVNLTKKHGFFGNGYRRKINLQPIKGCYESKKYI
jgi:hypothetical protein